MSDQNPPPPSVNAEPVLPRDPQRLAHLMDHRGLIIKRSLLAAALSGFIPIPVIDEYVAGRVRAGLYMRLAAARNVDLPQSAADLLGDPQDPSMLRNFTTIAVMLLAMKKAWNRLFALLRMGKGAEDMATNFQCAMLVDHYCARVHVGGPVTRNRAAQLHQLIHGSVDHTEKDVLVAAFRDGAKVLGKSVLEAPRWITDRLNSYAQRWAATGGRGAPFDPATDLPPDEAQGTDRWLDRAARVVEERLGAVGNDYLGGLVDRFEERWKNRPPEKEAPVQMHGEGWNPFRRKDPS
ncbi:MAG TPA: hypothetical protein VN914_16075 [Polyangia bacterium]|nr:hypothetical protein [Polyangia bacterium]